jgi:hypothetical protein
LCFFIFFHFISANDIESILIQIGAELVGGGARLDPGMANNYEYSESEVIFFFFLYLFCYCMLVMKTGMGCFL